MYQTYKKNRQELVSYVLALLGLKMVLSLLRTKTERLPKSVLLGGTGGDYHTIYIDNVVNFSAWLQERDVEPIDDVNEWSWLDELVEEYNEEMEE